MFFIFSCLFLAVATTASPRDLAADAEKYLLPGDVYPLHYSLSIWTHIENFKLGQEDSFQFDGLVNITILVLEDNVTEVVIHTYDIEIVSLSLSTNSSEAVSIEKGPYDSEANKQTLKVSPNLVKNQEYTLGIEYIGKNTNALTGFYRSSYFQGLERRWLVVTDFESFGARRAFPCFDEPKYKAKFQLISFVNETLVNDGYVTHFNTEIESVQNVSGYVKTTFQTTHLPISTYLVAFLVSDFAISPEPAYFNSSYAGEEGMKPFRTVGRRKFFEPRQDLLSQVAGPAVLEYMTNKTNIGFGFLKVDQAGIPDFAAGAMENWGMVTYREELLFWDEQSGSSNQQQSVVTVTAHELGHQWFGDLVTLHWWSDLWLNEGFATFYEFHAADQIREPTLDTSSWDLIGQFLVDITQNNAFAVDSISDSRPLTYEAYDRDTIDGFFDSISYDKGGSVLRMWRHILGEDVFYDGLEQYLTANREMTGTPESLLFNFDWVSTSAGFPLEVTELFRGWHQQPGFPVITVTRKNNQLNITQERYLWDAGENLKWNIPISYSTDLENNFEDTRPVAFLLESDELVTIEIKNYSASWIVVNNQATGYFRVNYDEENWETLIAVLEDPNTANSIHPYNRAQIYDDFSQLVGFWKKSSLNYGLVLRLLGALKHERSYAVWKSGLNVMNYLLDQLTSHPETHSLLKQYLSEIVSPVFHELSLNVKKNDAHSTKLLRVVIGKMACKLGMEVQQHVKLEPSADVRGIVLCASVKNMGTWEEILEKALEADSSVRRDLLSSLLCVDGGHFDSLLNALETEHRVTESDRQSIIAAASEGNSDQAMFALRMLSTRKLRTTKESSAILTKVARSLNTEEAAQLMEPLSKTHSKMIRLNRVWLEKKQPEILEWLQANL